VLIKLTADRKALHHI